MANKKRPQPVRGEHPELQHTGDQTEIASF